MTNLENGRYINSSDAFCLEYRPDTSYQSFYNDVVSYLGEYRFKIPQYDYQFLYAKDNLTSKSDVLETYHLLDPVDNQPMAIKAERAICKKKEQWKNHSREIADQKGILSLECQIAKTQNDNLIVWASPPGPAEDGYGDYGFIYIGEIFKPINSNDKNIKMTAFRIEKPTIDQYNQTLSILTNQKIKYSKAEEFIANPMIIPPINRQEIQNVLTSVFNFSADQNQEIIFRKVIKTLKPYIEEFAGQIQQGKPINELRKTFNALQNYAIKLKEIFAENQLFADLPFSAPSFSMPAVNKQMLFQLMVAQFSSYAPPVILGSCGSTESSRQLFKSPSIFSPISFLKNSILSEVDENFVCPACYQESKPPVGDSCPKCKITKEEAKHKGLVVC